MFVNPGKLDPSPMLVDDNFREREIHHLIGVSVTGEGIEKVFHIVVGDLHGIGEEFEKEELILKARAEGEPGVFSRVEHECTENTVETTLHEILVEGDGGNVRHDG